MRLVTALLLVIATGCGGGVVGQPIPPATTPAPIPEPEPPPAPPGQVTGIAVAELGQDFVLWTWNPVEGATGYEAAPYLAADPEGERNILFVEEPSVRVDGFQPNTAVWIHVRAVRETAGGRAVGEWSNRVFAETWGEPRECSNEREQALAFGVGYSWGPPVLIEEWDGLPFHFYFDAGIPASERADAEHFFEVVENLSDRIEDQIGFSILEVAGWVEEDERGFSRGNPEPCEGVRPGGIVATVTPRSRGGAIPSCAIMYWPNDDIDTALDGTMAHELFHLFGFTHSPESTHPQQSPPGVGVPMSVRLTNEFLSATDLGVTFEDVDALRCVFPID